MKHIGLLMILIGTFALLCLSVRAVYKDVAPYWSKMKVDEKIFWSSLGLVSFGMAISSFAL